MSNIKLMSREEAMELLKQEVKQKNLIKHCLAVEAVMGRLATHFGENEEKWALAGLLHDIDYDETADDPMRHSMLGAQMLADRGLDEEIVYAVRVHNDTHGLPRKSVMDKALFASDPLTGLIVASALIHPAKKLHSIDTDFVVNRFKEKNFAKGANREQIACCSEMGLTLEEFVALGLEAMQAAHQELGL
jgi:putative nucleotidyltransferase with HDIG domain